eukprot:3737414-Amphidinium_carterae.1
MDGARQQSDPVEPDEALLKSLSKDTPTENGADLNTEKLRRVQRANVPKNGRPILFSSGTQQQNRLLNIQLDLPHVKETLSGRKATKKESRTGRRERDVVKINGQRHSITGDGTSDHVAKGYGPNHSVQDGQRISLRKSSFR